MSGSKYTGGGTSLLLLIFLHCGPFYGSSHLLDSAYEPTWTNAAPAGWWPPHALHQGGKITFQHFKPSTRLELWHPHFVSLSFLSHSACSKTSSFNQPSYSKKPPSVPERIQGRTASTRAVPPKFSINLGKPHAAGDAENDASIFWVTGGDRRNTGIPINGYDHKKGMWWSWYVMTMIIDWVWGTRFSPMQSGLFAGKPGRGSGQFSMCIRFSNWAYLIYLHIFEHGDFPASVHISTVTLLILPGPPDFLRLSSLVSRTGRIARPRNTVTAQAGQVATGERDITKKSKNNGGMSSILPARMGIQNKSEWVCPLGRGSKRL